jgi:cytochrome b subunit of formate dehydrogenase
MSSAFLLDYDTIIAQARRKLAREQYQGGLMSTAWMVVIGVVAVIVVVGAVMFLPDFFRYMKIRSM